MDESNTNKNTFDDDFTFFAPAFRNNIEDVNVQIKKILKSPDFQRLTDSIPNIFMILNSSRQLVYANSRLSELLQINDLNKLIGQRPGEIFDCVHSTKNRGGCGTSENCEMCGAVNAIVQGLEGNFCINECRILTGNGTDALDLKVWATPYKVDDEDYVIFAIEDISSEKRKTVLERTFFHDIINTAGGLKGLAELLKESPEDIHEFKDLIFELTDSLIDEINAQKQLLAAENSELAVNLTEVNSIKLLNSVIDTYKKHSVSENKNIVLKSDSANIEFSTDETLTKRVIGNMLKNALEASSSGGTVTLSCKGFQDNIDFSVHNESVMPREVKLQMFQRSFSTKGNGRGIGTYSMKLLTEKYLKGKIDFTSQEGEGTVFTASLPK